MNENNNALRHTIKISDEAHIGGSIWMEPHTRLGSVEVFPDCRMGMHSYMVSGLIRSSVSIGRYCSIGRDVSVGTGEHALEALSTGGEIQNRYPSKKYSLADKSRNIRTIIDHDVWIGDKSIIFSGVNVGIGAVVGASSVVTSDLPPYSIAVGAPARVIRYRFDDYTIKRLLSSRWFDYDLKDILSMYDGNINNFLDSLEKCSIYPIYNKDQHLEVYKKLKNIRTELRIRKLEDSISILQSEISRLGILLNGASKV